MTQLEIPNGEIGQIRLFAVNRPIDKLARDLRDGSKEALIADLLGRSVPEGSAELFPVSDLTGVGLARYLNDGYAVPPDQISRDRARLDALDGYVLLLFSSAFEGQETTLKLGPDLTMIGTYGETQPDMSVIPLEAESAQPYTGAADMTPKSPPEGGAGGMMVLLAVIVLIGLILWWLL
jgi:hypothetical protein